MTVVVNPAYFPPRLGKADFKSYFLLILSGLEKRDEAIENVFLKFGSQYYKNSMVFIYDPYQEQHNEIIACFEEKHKTPVEVPAFVVTNEHPSSWENALNCVKVNRGFFDIFLQKGDIYLFDLLVDFHGFCAKNELNKANEKIINEKIFFRLKSVWSEAKEILGVSLSLM